ncbi:MAG: hypothetical protein D6748_16325 [Calditrichaeota bacterium]|nr:MAG: hypothetical protein D6748_16325 [Calditrichota bacterium]
MKTILQDLITLTGFCPQDLEILHQMGPHIVEWVPAMVDVLSDLVSEFAPPLSSGNVKPSDQENILKNWLSEIIHGRFDLSFWKHQWLLQLSRPEQRFHNHILLIAIVSRLQTFFLAQCLREFELPVAKRLYLAFKRLTDTMCGMVIEGVFEMYLNAAETSTGIKRSVLAKMVSTSAEKLIKKEYQKLMSQST